MIDTGADILHPELASQIFANSAETLNGADDDGNLCIDDIPGCNLTTGRGIAVPGGVSIGSGDGIDDEGHGTHVSGTIAAVTNEGVGVAGVNWNAKVLPIKFVGGNNTGSTEAALESIKYARKMGVFITNNSWANLGSYDPTWPADKAMYDTVAAGANDSIFVAAAGNEFGWNNDEQRDIPGVRTSYPASFDLHHIIAVASVNCADAISSFSSIGLYSVDIAAPGDTILSTALGSGATRLGGSFISGTSMAAPHVTGVASLVWDQFPTLKNLDVKKLLIQASTPLPSLNGKIGGGLLNVNNAIRQKLIFENTTVDPSKPASLETFVQKVVKSGAISYALKGSSFNSNSGTVSLSIQFPTNTFIPATNFTGSLSSSSMNITTTTPGTAIATVNVPAGGPRVIIRFSSLRRIQLV